MTRSTQIPVAISAITGAILGFILYRALLSFALTLALNMVNPVGRVVDLSIMINELEKALRPIGVLSIDEIVVCDSQTLTPYAANSSKVGIGVCHSQGSQWPLTVKRRLAGFVPSMDLVLRTHYLAILTWLISFAFLGVFILLVTRKVLQSRRQLRDELLTNKILARASAQVAHDIRSPLTALNMILSKTDGVNIDQKKLLGLAINSINDLAEGLLHKRRSLVSPPGLSILKPVKSRSKINDVLEKFIELKGIELSSKTRIRFSHNMRLENPSIEVSLPAKELENVLSNLLNNSIESIDESGFVTLDVEHSNNEVIIEIRDSGRGIPKPILARLGTENISYGKLAGNGLGLYNAKRLIEMIGGTLRIFSTEGRGTSVRIELPIVN